LLGSRLLQLFSYCVNRLNVQEYEWHRGTFHNSLIRVRINVINYGYRSSNFSGVCKIKYPARLMFRKLDTNLHVSTTNIFFSFISLLNKGKKLCFLIIMPRVYLSITNFERADSLSQISVRKVNLSLHL
jgi:hypothetical protein